MFFTIVLVLIATLIVLDYFNKKRKSSISHSIKGPAYYPLIGNLFILQQRTVEDAIKNIVNMVKVYGKVMRVWYFNQMCFIVTDPKALEVILSSPKYIRKNTIYDFIRKWLNEGLLLSNGKKWFQRRKILTPAFHFKILEDFVTIFDERSNVLIDILKEKSEKGAFDISPYITLQALDIVSESAMGTKIDTQQNPNCEYAQAVHTMSDVAMERVVKPYLRNDTILALFAPKINKMQDNALKVLHGFTRKIINERRDELLKSKATVNAEQDEFGSKRKMALLDILLQSTIDGKPLTNADIQEEVDTFMFAGHDTTSSGIDFTLHLLSRHPDIQDKVFAEIREVIGDDKTKPVTIQDLNELKYLELVIKESMRMFPPVPLIGRKLEEDLVYDDVLLPAGSDITIPIYIVLRDPDLFPNPDKFDPERHSPENSSERSSAYAYIPFSAGPRNCIGQKFGMLELKSTTSKILRHFELLPLGEEPQATINLVTRSKTGINLGIRPRVYM